MQRVATRSSQATTFTQQTNSESILHNDGGAGIYKDYTIATQANYAGASILLRDLLLVPMLLPGVPRLVLVVLLHPGILEASAASSTSRGTHQPG